MFEQTQTRPRQTGVAERDLAPAQDSVQGHTLSDFLRLLFRLLDENAIRYCVLHSWEGLPDSLPSDLDMAVHPRDRAKLAQVFQGLLAAGYRPVQCRHHAGGHRFDFVWLEPQGVRAAGLDVTDKYREHGMTLWRGEELAKERWQFRGFWVAGPAVEFAYTLARRS